MNPITKAQKLAHYAKKPLTELVQIDGFPKEMCDDIILDCGKGFGMIGQKTRELMTFHAPVRVLIRKGTSPDLVKKLLQGAAEFYSPDTHTESYPSELRAIGELEDAAAILREEAVRVTAPIFQDWPRNARVNGENDEFTG